MTSTPARLWSECVGSSRMREYRVVMTPAARERIGNVVAYIRDELASPQAAERLLDDLLAAVEGLSRMPNRFHAVGIVLSDSVPVRRMNVRDYSLYYGVYEGEGVVRIITVAYGSVSDAQLRELLGDARPRGEEG